MYFYISCSLRWFPAALTTEKRIVTQIMCDRTCSEQFPRPEVNIIRIFIALRVYWYRILIKIVDLDTFSESLNIKPMIESGVVCRPLCSAVGQMCFQKKAYIRIKPKKFEFWPIYYWSLLRSAYFDIFSDPLCYLKGS